MARRKKVQRIIEQLEVIDMASDGKCVSRDDNKVYFTKFTAPGDVIDLKVTRDKASYGEGLVEKYHVKSPLRVEPICDYFELCGGCKWQHIGYETQLSFKQKQVTDTLSRLAKIDLPKTTPIVGSDNVYTYRNKMDYTFTDRYWLTREEMESGQEFPDRRGLGFHVPGGFDKVIDIQKCHLQDDFTNVIRNFVRDYALSKDYSFYNMRSHEGLLRNLIIRMADTGETMVIVQFGQDIPDQIEDVMQAINTEFSDLTSLLYLVNLKGNETLGDQDILCYSGKEFIEEEMEGLRFRIGPKSFYQTNSAQAFKLYTVTRNLADISSEDIVYDLYTGTGTIALFVAKQAKKVVGVEYVPEAIEDAKINADVNNITNTAFYAGDMKDVLNDKFVQENGEPNVVIVDPPRAGMHPDVIDALLRMEAPKIVYVSCNPATQARDLELLDVKYKVAKIQPVDMFPQTHHVENVVALELRK